jgi:glycosyltransferase involved in cell wall biosynthesis
MQSNLLPDVEKKLKKIGHADIVVGIPSFNNASTIGHVMRAARLGLTKYFPKFKSIIVNSDCGSTDGTGEAVKNSNGYSNLNTILINEKYHPSSKKLCKPAEIITTYDGIPGKGMAFKTIFTIARKLKAKACVTIDSDLRSINPEWIQLLAGPIIYRGYDLVLPEYYRHKYDGTITNSIIYPMIRALYGLRIRQPIGGDTAISKKLIDYCIDQDWFEEVCQYGIDIFITTSALANKMKVCQSFLGTKIHDSKDPKFSLGPMFRQVIATLFILMTKHKNRWLKITSSKPATTFGFWAEAAPSETKITVPALIDSFKKGVKKHIDFWASFIDKGNLTEIKKISKLPQKYFYIPDSTWVRIVYDFASFSYKILAQNPSDDEKSLLNQAIASMTDLYFGWVASYAIKTETLGIYEAEKQIEELAIEYEKQKPYLIKKCGLNK